LRHKTDKHPVGLWQHRTDANPPDPGPGPARKLIVENNFNFMFFRVFYNPRWDGAGANGEIGKNLADTPSQTTHSCSRTPGQEGAENHRRAG
jgi:hypothetical protein